MPGMADKLAMTTDQGAERIKPLSHNAAGVLLSLWSESISQRRDAWCVWRCGCDSPFEPALHKKNSREENSRW